MTKFEKKAIDYIKKNFLIIFLIIISLFSLLIRAVPIRYASGDYEGFLKFWFEYLKSKGGLPGLATYIGDYNAPYMTIMALLTYIPIRSLYSIKAVSILFDFILAASSGYLASMLVKNNKKVYATITYSLVLLMPQVIANSAMWAQCDSIYSSFAVIALILLLKEKYWQSFIFLGISFAFKLQFIFILPVYVIIYICKNKFSILNFLIIPLMNFIMCLPAIIIGKPITEIIGLYFNQTSEYSQLVLNYPNIYSIIRNFPMIKMAGIIITASILLLILFYCVYKKVKWNNEKIITLALLSIIIVTYTLPGMHERYVFLGEVLSIIYYLVYRKYLSLVIMVNLNAIITYSNYLIGSTITDYTMISIIYGIIIIYFTINSLNFIGDNSKEVITNE